MPVGCTVWLFGDQPHSFLTAGHCGPSSSNVVQFNVPLSTAGGTPQNPAPQDQYPVDPSSFQGTGSGVGNDWSFFGTFANSNTGQAPRDAMGTSYTLATVVPAADQRDIRITGYGSTSSPVPGSWNLAQKTDVGSFVSAPGSSLRYNPDTTGGNSGSAVLDDTTNTAIGIHTHGGCSSSGGSNQGTSLINSGLQNALANPRGITVPLGLDLDLVTIAPDFINPAGGDVITVRVSPDNGRDPSGEVTLWVDTGSGFQPRPMTEGAADIFTATFPPADCAVSVRYYFTAQDTTGSNWSLPTAGASGALTTFTGSGIEIAVDDNFETNQGWTVQNTSLQTGAWTRAIPGNYGRQDPTTDADNSGRAYVTGNGVNEDVDGGPTILTSPTIDLSAMNSPFVTYARWHQTNSSDDRLFVEFSSNNGASWVVAESIQSAVGWVNVELAVADFVTPTTSEFRVRFRVADVGSPSIVESGVDAFRVFDIVCDNPCPADFSPPGGNGVLNFDDVVAFLGAYNAGDPSADINASGDLNFFDVNEFLAAYNTGCP
jgi:V8-like Glu-specific endopeptidase